MQKHLLKQIFEQHSEEIVAKSFFDCHCKGLHSIMLLEKPEQTIRLYIADIGNELYKNFLYPTENGRIGMSIGFHPHHCDLTLACLKGKLYNWVMEESEPRGGFGFFLNKYLYNSKITKGETKFEPLGESVLQTVEWKWIREGEGVSMKANEIHTVACYPDEITTWMVHEGKEDENYIPYCWSNVEVDKQDLSNLYRKPTYDEVKSLLEKCELI